MKIVTLINFMLVSILPGCDPTKEVITESDISKLMSRWEEAYLSKNTDILNEILEDRWVYSGNADGSTSDKQATIEELKHSKYALLSLTFKNLNIEYYDDVAIIRGTESLQLQLEEGDTSVLLLRFTDVYKKKNGLTRAIATHSSPISY